MEYLRQSLHQASPSSNVLAVRLATHQLRHQILRKTNNTCMHFNSRNFRAKHVIVVGTLQFFKYLHLMPCNWPGLILPPLVSSLLAFGLVVVVCRKVNFLRDYFAVGPMAAIVGARKSRIKIVPPAAKRKTARGRGKVRAAISTRSVTASRSRSRNASRSGSFLAGRPQKAREATSGELLHVMRIDAPNVYAEAGPVKRSRRPGSRSRGRPEPMSSSERRFEKVLIEEARSKTKQAKKPSRSTSKSKTRRSGRGHSPRDCC